jgi:hypothetical protein
MIIFNTSQIWRNLDATNAVAETVASALGDASFSALQSQTVPIEERLALAYIQRSLTHV